MRCIYPAVRPRERTPLFGVRGHAPKEGRRDRGKDGLWTSGKKGGSDPAWVISHSGGRLPARGWWQLRQQRIGRSRDSRSEVARGERVAAEVAPGSGTGAGQRRRPALSMGLLALPLICLQALTTQAPLSGPVFSPGKQRVCA